MSRLLSPVVRRLIAEHGLDPDTIQGTGAGGRITRSDVLQVVEGGARPAATAGAPATGDVAVAAAETKRLASEDAPAAKGQPLKPGPDDVAREAAEAASRGKAPTPAPASAPVAGERDEVVPFTNIRRRTAEHMVRSKATSAHALVVMEVDYDNVDRVRNVEKAGFKQDEGVGPGRPVPAQRRGRGRHPRSTAPGLVPPRPLALPARLAEAAEAGARAACLAEDALPVARAARFRDGRPMDPRPAAAAACLAAYPARALARVARLGRPLEQSSAPAGPAGPDVPAGAPARPAGPFLSPGTLAAEAGPVVIDRADGVPGHHARAVHISPGAVVMALAEEEAEEAGHLSSP